MNWLFDAGGMLLAENGGIVLAELQGSKMSTGTSGTFAFAFSGFKLGVSLVICFKSSCFELAQVRFSTLCHWTSVASTKGVPTIP